MIDKCSLCKLSEYRRKQVNGRGTIPCQLLIIGDNPGIKEDMQGKAFVGPDGKVLDKVMNKACTLDGMLIRKPSFYMTNTVLCHPCDWKYGKTREPRKEEIYACYRNITGIVEACQPSAIILLGKVAQRYFKKEYPEAIHMMHPSFLLKTGSEGSPYFLPAVRQMLEVYKRIYKGLSYAKTLLGRR
jgi:DNA polymerase